MSPRDLPARPDLDQLKHQAKDLRSAFLRGDPDAAERVRAILGPRTTLKLTEAQRVVARELGFPTWARLRARVQASLGVDAAVDAFLGAVSEQDAGRARAVLEAEPRVATASLHVASALGLDAEVRRLLAEDPARVHAKAGPMEAEPLMWLAYSPFHGESPGRDDGLLASARALLDGGADPNTRDARWGVPVLQAVTGQRSVPRIARLLLEAGAKPTDGESVFHAAEHFHEDALALLAEYGVDLNYVGEWGNTALHFLLLHWDLAREDRVQRGFRWLLDHGADPDVRSGRERETALHAAARRGQDPAIVRLLLDHGADVHARRGDGRTAWLLATRGGHEDVVAVLQRAGAAPEPIAPADRILGACGRGDPEEAQKLADPAVVAVLGAEDLAMLPDAALRGRIDVVRACLRAGFPIGAPDPLGATALHHACIHGRAAMAAELVDRGADIHLRDPQHNGSPVGWACFGADFFGDPDGDWAGCVRVLLDAGATWSAEEDHRPVNPEVVAVLRRYGAV